MHIDPLGQPKVTGGRDHFFRTCCPSVCPSPLFKSSKTKQQKTMFATGVTMGLAEWIIDDSCLVSSNFNRNKFILQLLIYIAIYDCLDSQIFMS